MFLTAVGFNHFKLFGLEIDIYYQWKNTELEQTQNCAAEGTYAVKASGFMLNESKFTSIFFLGYIEIEGRTCFEK